MASHGAVAGRVRADKGAHPEKYCQATARCLWRTGGANGSPCRKHQTALNRLSPDDTTPGQDAGFQIQPKETNMATRIILDNGGSLILQLGDWAVSYDGYTTAAIAKQAAQDIREWLKTGTTDGWEGNDPDALSVDPTDDEIRNGGYQVIEIRWGVDTAETLAREVRWGAMGEALGDALEAKPDAK